MKVTRTDRSKVASLANALHHQKGLSLSAAWKKAWKVVKLKKQLNAGLANFTYIKKDGTLRQATGTTNSEFFNYTRKTDRSYSALYVRYFDTEKNNFRQFAAERIA
jgi:hypothetical protein